MKIQVQIVQGPAADCSFTIEKNSRCIVGRGEEVDFRITNDELISREHFLIQFDGKHIALMDLGSTNGTFVDGQALVKDIPVYLSNGQSFVAGRVSQFVINLVGEPVEPLVAPTNMPLPSSNQPTNFGSSIYTAGDGPPEISPSSTPEQTGGNFSQSIVKGIGGSSELGSEITDPCEQSGLLFANPNPGQGIELGRSEPHSPPGHSASSPPPDHGGGPSGIDPALDHHGSIAVPGDVDGVGYQFPPLEKDPPQPTPPASSETAPPIARNPAPAEIAQPPSANPPSSPFASIQVNPVDLHAAVPPVSSTPVQPTASPIETIPPPLSPPQTSSGSISMPGNPQSIEPVPSSGPDVFPTTSSIGLPSRMPVDLPETPSEVKPSEETAVPPGKTGFYLRQQPNGLFVHSGKDEADLVQVLKVLQDSFESVYCADLKRAGIEMTPESEPGNDDSESGPEAGGESNFLGLNAQDEDSSVQAFESLKEDDAESGGRAKIDATSPVKLGQPLFHWLPSEIRWDHPVLLSCEEFSFDIKDFWQADALVCLFGSSAKQISDHCLELIKINIRTGKQGDAMFGFCWPSILGCTLESAPEKSVNRIFKGGVAAILLEDPQQEMCWNIVSKTDLTELLTLAGFVRKNP